MPDGSVSVRCNYGIDGAFPANRPAPWVWYDLKGMKPGQCWASGPNVVCKLL